jgi:hypothetical protein
VDRQLGRRLTRKQMWVISGALLVAAFWGVPLAYRVVMEPWSIGIGGRDTLLGTWTGSLRAKQGAEYGLYLDLAYREKSLGYRRGAARSQTNLTGRAVLCSPVGQRFEYALSGSAGRSGDIKQLWLEYGDPKLSALNFRMSGVWRQGALTLTLPRHNPFLPDGRFITPRTVSTPDPEDYFAPTTLTARDRATFETICQRIRR